MATAPAAKANAAFVDEDYDLALALYKQVRLSESLDPCWLYPRFKRLLCPSQAINDSPEDPSLYSQRAQTHIKLENYIDAAEDAGKAIELDPKTGRHHHRKG